MSEHKKFDDLEGLARDDVLYSSQWADGTGRKTKTFRVLSPEDRTLLDLESGILYTVPREGEGRGTDALYYRVKP